MSVKITDADVYSTPGDSNLANGSFEFYRAGTNERRFAKTNPEATLNGPFQNALNANSRPVQDLWVDDITALDVVFRDDTGAEIIRGALSTYIDKLIVVPTSGGASQVEVTAAIAGSFNQYTQANVPTV